MEHYTNKSLTSYFLTVPNNVGIAYPYTIYLCFVFSPVSASVPSLVCH